MVGDKATVRLTLLGCLALQGIFVLQEHQQGRALSSDWHGGDAQHVHFSNESSVVNDTEAKILQNLLDGILSTTPLPPSNNQARNRQHSTAWDLDIDELVQTSNYTASDCDPRLVYMNDTILASAWSRKIPKVVHITGFTRCLSRPFYDNIQQWRLHAHAFYFHDEAAVDRLLQQEYWPEFPQLANLQHCMVSGAAKADLWRYLILYRYGGIYTDMDSAPGEKFVLSDNVTTIISDDDDGFFVVERVGCISQYFMATSPRHPFMFMAVQQVFARLLDTDSIGEQYVPFVTGPGALKNAYIRFMGRKKAGL